MMERISVLGRPSIIVGSDLLSGYIAKDIRNAAPAASKFVIITDKIVKKLYLHHLLKTFSDAAIPPEHILQYEVPVGEHSKSRDQKAMIEDYMLERSCNRDTCIVALGGGVVGDLSGFVAATYMRGIPFIQIPTTLLAMVDSSIGGKTGINTMYAKNQLGSFHQPVRIYMDLTVLRSLPTRQMSNGMAEIIKTFAIADEENFHYLEEHNDQVFACEPEALLRIVASCARIKARYVTEDETEQGVRSLLNFGHTIGHAIESICMDFMLHGECVAIGMVKEAEIARAMGHLAPSCVQRLASCIKLYGLPLVIPPEAEIQKMMDKMKLDKKNAGGKKKCVLLSRIGDVVEPRASIVSDAQLQMALSKMVQVVPGAPINGQIRVPGSKSLSNRVLLLAALAEGECRVSGLLHSDDTQVCLKALKQLEAATFTYEKSSLPGDKEDILLVAGRGQPGQPAHVRQPKEPIYLGNAGTATRFLASVCALVSEDEASGRSQNATVPSVVLTGDKRMCERPIKDLVDALRKHQNSRIDYLGGEGCPPLRIYGTGLPGGDVQLAANISSQFVSSILISGPYATKPITLHLDTSKEVVSQPYIDMTISMMKGFGIEVEVSEDKHTYKIPTGVYRNPPHYAVECDASSSTYPLAMAAITGGKVTALHVGSNSVQGDAAFCYVLEKMGCKVQQDSQHTTVEGPEGGLLRGVDVDMNHLTDAFMGIAVLAAVAKGTTRITGIANQRVKECNRIAVMVEQLSKLGVVSRELDDGIEVEGSDPSTLHGAHIECYNDHRISMSFAVLGCKVPGIIITDKECTQKTYPEFWDDFVSILGGTLKVADEDTQTPSASSERKLGGMTPPVPVPASEGTHKKDRHHMLVIIGMRGAGKTTQGRAAAHHLGYDFVDVDEIIESRLGSLLPQADSGSQGASLPLIKRFVEEKGWEAFRVQELEAFQHILSRYNNTSSSKGVVISCGGGIIQTEPARLLLKDLINKGTPVVHLQRNIEDISAFLLGKDKDRPAFSEHPRDIYATRLPWYIESSSHDHVMHGGHQMAGEGKMEGWNDAGKEWLGFVDKILKQRAPTNQQGRPKIFATPGDNTFFLSLTFPDYKDLSSDLLEEISAGIHVLEFRADLLSDANPANVARQLGLLHQANLHSLPVIYTVRTRAQGGNFLCSVPPGPEDDERILAMVRAGIRAGCEIIDVESGWSSRVHEEIMRLKSTYGFGVIGSCHVYTESTWSSDERILDIFKGCCFDDEVDIVKVVLQAFKAEHASRFHQISITKAKQFFRGPIIAVCTGDIGRLSRVLNRTLTPVTHPRLPFKAAPGQMSAREINMVRAQLGLIPPKNYFLFGNPIAQSRSPVMHNTGFREVGLPHTYQLFPTEDATQMKEVLALDTTGGASVTIPNKETVLPLLGHLSSHARCIGAVNTVARRGPTLTGDNTDWLAVRALTEARLRRRSPGHVPPDASGLTCLVIGAGGTARAVCYALGHIRTSHHVNIFLHNRTYDKAVKVAKDIYEQANISVHILDGGLSLPHPQMNPPDIVVSTVPLQAQEDVIREIGQWAWSKSPIALDLVYKPRRTPFLEAARKTRDASADGSYDVEGIDILLEQGFEQFKIWTGTPVAPMKTMREAVMRTLDDK
eukprot:TRINITY_DN6867_c0_g1_i6.p1 TRINITY_DN6867_c0_g1~~TRINITY_DN6867_c0_g1_i6.p1  ORF type:complete len:1625 (-),score=356.69 TRINITY_DN6867_c0_g1_i6:74-4948(-)